MITAQDIREKTFEKSTFGGYAMNEVDDFLDELASDLAASQKESATLRGKMKVLVDKIEEYRESEDAMHLALVSAQKVAKSIEEESRAKAEELVASAQAEADAILSAARAEAEAVTGSIAQQRQAEELRYQKAQSAAAEYIQTTSKKLAETLTYLNSLKEADLLGAIVTPAPDERKAIAAPAGDDAQGEEIEEAQEVQEIEEPADEPVEEAAPAEEPQEVFPQEGTFADEPEEELLPTDDEPDYVQAFERAVYDYDDAIPDAEDGDNAPMFRF